MRFTTTMVAACVATALSSTDAQAGLRDNALLIFETDAVTTYGINPANGIEEWYVSSDGPLADSFFSLGGAKTKQMVDVQFAYLYGYPDALIFLDEFPEYEIGTFTFFGYPGRIRTVGTGISILSESGDAASVDMSGLVMEWPGATLYQTSLGSGAWSSGYTNGVGNITCTPGSGCEPGSEFTLKYTATIPAGDSSGFGGVKFYLELHGMHALPIPEASTYGMMLAGLGLVGFAARQRKPARGSN